MKKETEMYKEIIEKRLARKREQLIEIEKVMAQGDISSIEKSNYVKLKAAIQELENILDIAETLFNE